MQITVTQRIVDPVVNDLLNFEDIICSSSYYDLWKVGRWTRIISIVTAKS